MKKLLLIIAGLVILFCIFSVDFGYKRVIKCRTIIFDLQIANKHIITICPITP